MKYEARVFLVAALSCGAAAGCAPSAEETPATDAPRVAPAPDDAAPTGQFEFTEIVPDVYQARGVGDMSVGSNAAVIVNADDVLLVDSHISPAAADALLEELAALTDRPVRFVINTHWHFDHVHGNQVYPPGVEIIGHETTRAVIAAGGSVSGRSYDLFLGSLPDQIAQAQAAIDTMTDAQARAEAETALEAQRRFQAQVSEVVPTPPNTTLSERMTLFRGEREIRLLFFGRGHTEGDVVVHLPGDGVLITGDLITAGLPYMGDGFVNEWVDTLEQLKSLEFEWIIPGHGQAYRDRERIDHLQGYLRDLWSQADRLHREGVPAAEAAGRIDLRAHAPNFAGITALGADPVAVVRIHELLDARTR